MQQQCLSAVDLKLVRGCGSSNWANRLAPLALASPVMINIGANTGYAIAEFLARFSNDPAVSVSPRAWQDRIRRYARLVNSTGLRMFSCGACSQCRDRRSPWHNAGGRPTAHALELDLKNRQLLRHLSKSTGTSVSVHELAASDKQGHACAALGVAGFEKHAIAQTTASENPGARFCRRGQQVKMVTVDWLMRNLSLASVEHLSMDTEGWDAKILYAAQRSVTRRAFRVIEFEYHVRWKEHQTSLQALQEWLFAAGYHCFFITKRPGLLVPLSGACWRAEFERYKWSNLVCAHTKEYLNVLYGMREASD